MPLMLCALLSAGLVRQTSTTSLTREFKSGEKFAYRVLSHITAEQRGGNLSTWIPSDLDINYNFTYTVDKMLGDGVAVLHYQRPTMTEIEGETFDSPPKTNVQKVNIDALVTVSPVNEVLEEKDLGKKASAGWTNPAHLRSYQGAKSFFTPFISDVHRMALFIGSVQDALDFSPKFPLRPIKVGDTWKKTVGYQPQKLKGSSGKQAVQRLDYTYTYLGPMTSHGSQVLRVQGKLDLSTDVAEYFKQLLGEQASETDVQKVPLNFQSTIDFDLDPKTRDLLRGEGKTKGGFQVFLKEQGSTAVEEERFTGQTSIELVGRKQTTGS